MFSKIIAGIFVLLLIVVMLLLIAVPVIAFLFCKYLSDYANADENLATGNEQGIKHEFPRTPDYGRAGGMGALEAGKRLVQNHSIDGYFVVTQGNERGARAGTASPLIKYRHGD